MASTCKIQVRQTTAKPFHYSATIVLDGFTAAASPLESHYSYGDGDLAVFLEDLGVEVPAILLLLDRLTEAGSAEAPVNVAPEFLEVLSRHVRPEI
jgi:hypothetical protein